MLAAPDQLGAIVSDAAGTISTQPGWYADPSGAPRLRWWDGAQWTEHLHDPAPAKSGALRTSDVGPDTPVYSASIWMIVGLPLLSVFAIASFDMTEYMLNVTTLGLRAAATELDYLFLQGLGTATYIASVIFAILDRRGLRADGFHRPFHWAWAILSVTVYVIGRSVIVNRRAGRGLWPIGALLALIVLQLVVVGLKVSEAMPALLMGVSAS